MKLKNIAAALTALVILSLGGGIYIAWLMKEPSADIALRVPSEERIEGLFNPSAGIKAGESTGKLYGGKGAASLDEGGWLQFRGNERTNIVVTGEGLFREALSEPAKVLWREKTGEGYAGVAVNRGKVYLIDYDQKSKEDSIRCLSLKDGREIWKYNYPVKIKRNHGMSRTVPAVTDKYLVTLGPLGHLTCLNSTTGELIWNKDLVKEYGAKIPEWYAGQCPLIDGELLIIAPAGKEVLITALKLKSGKTQWSTKNQNSAHKMTHSTVAIFDFPGEKQYVYCASNGVVSVAAGDGRVLWTDPSWKINIANVPTPVPVDREKILFSGGYDSGSKYLRVIKEQKTGIYKLEEIFKVKASVFASQQATPIFYKGYFYGVLPDGQLACVDEAGKQLWKSGNEKRFGLGPFIITEPKGMLFILNDMTGILYQVKAEPFKYEELGSMKIMNGHEAWAPLALVNGKLLAKDLTELVCVELR
ncbi:MAG: PQQ-like beta-propeller repeat protein [Candidatus Firestonebacteria bacterium]|nr:PQQ-like beta-propeller repeat protein [Candidatus Firestonebacteria bacterium]